MFGNGTEKWGGQDIEGKWRKTGLGEKKRGRSLKRKGVVSAAKKVSHIKTELRLLSLSSRQWWHFRKSLWSGGQCCQIPAGGGVKS